MAVEQVTLAPDAIPDLLKLINSLSRWLQAIGGLFVFIVVANIINIIINRKKLKRVIALQRELEKVEDYLERVIQSRTHHIKKEGKRHKKGSKKLMDHF